MTKPFKIWIEDKKTFEEVVKQMDKNGVRWFMSQDYASADIDRYNFPPIALFVSSDNTLSWSDNELFFKDHEYSEITPEEYLKRNKTITKADLRDWMIVEDDLCRRYFVNVTSNEFLQYNDAHGANIIISMDEYNDELYNTHSGNYITKVFQSSITRISRVLVGKHLIIWEREEPAVEMTIAEIKERLGIKNLKIVDET